MSQRTSPAAANTEQHEHRAPSDCPVCGEHLAVTRLGCTSCGTELAGLFAACPYCSLGQKDLDLLSSISGNIGGKTLCAFGDAAVTPVLTTLKHFRGEYESHIKEGRCTLPAPWRAQHPVGAH